jgi:membrane protein implicated in regulation of membrane protease activity
MDQIVAFLAGMTYWHWFALGAVLLILEILTPTFYLIWFGIAAVAAGLLKLAMPDISWETSLTVFAIMSVVSTVIWHGFYKRGGHARHEDGRGLNQRVSGYVGRRALVAEGFRNGRGPILLDDSRWEAIAEGGLDLSPGASVEITGADGVTLRVRPT